MTVSIFQWNLGENLWVIVWKLDFVLYIRKGGILGALWIQQLYELQDPLQEYVAAHEQD